MGGGSMSESYYFIPCVIERGGFSSERTFEIKMHDGGKLVGTANVEYLRTESRTVLDENSPRIRRTPFRLCEVPEGV